MRLGQARRSWAHSRRFVESSVFIGGQASVISKTSHQAGLIMKKLLDLLPVNPWIIGGLALAFLSFAGAEEFRIHRLGSALEVSDARADASEAKLTTVTASRDMLKASLDRQNAAVDALGAKCSADAQAAEKRAGEALKAGKRAQAVDDADASSGPARMNGFFGLEFKK